MKFEWGSIKRRFVDRLIREDSGQDLVEYGLLVGIIATAAALVLPPLAARLGSTFTGGQSSVNQSWIPNPPQ